MAYTAEEQDWLARNPGDEHRMKEALSNDTGNRMYDSQDPTKQDANHNYNGGEFGQQTQSQQKDSSGNNVTQAWSGPQTSAYDGMLREMFDRQKAAEEARMAKEAAVDAERKQKADTLYGDLSTRAHQSLAIDRNDPLIRQQSDAYSANETRASRNFIGDLAERAGPTANILGEQRLATERVGQRTGSFEAELMGRELQSRRDEIAQALQGMGGILSADQAAGLQRELASLDAAIKQQSMAIDVRGQDNSYALGSRGLDVQSQLGNRGLDMDWQRALMQNDQFGRSLGFNTEDRASYWDAVRRGLL